MTPEENTSQDSVNQSRVGFYAALLTALLTIVTFGIAILTPPLSGPLCTTGCYDYPFTDVISRFPRDYYWMYPAMLLMLIYTFLMVCVNSNSPADRKIFGQTSVIMAAMSTIVLLIDYFIQVSVIQPSLLNNETDGIALWSQYNPHGIFIVLEELGYILMSLSFLFMAFVYTRKTRLENIIKWVLICGFVLTLLSFIYFSYMHGVNREYRFEIAVISINWLVLIIYSILQSRIFRRYF